MQETMLQNRKPVIRSYWLVGACIAVGFIASICIGNYPISIREIISILTGGEVGAMTRKVFFTLRLPRTCMGVMAGAGLGVAGSVYQMIFRNPLASPDIIGVSSGANLGAAIAIVSVGIGVGGIALGAFAGGLLAAFILFVILYMAGAGQWLCIGFGASSASALVWLTFRLNAKYGEHGLMKLGAARMRPRYLLHRRKTARMFKQRKKKKGRTV